jgi:hypothetical protein
MKPLASTSLLLPLLFAACATGVTQDLPNEEVGGGSTAGSTSGGAPVATEGGKSSGTAGKGGSSPVANPFGGSASTAGTGGKASGGAAGTTGSAGVSNGGSSGSPASAGSGGTSSAGTGSGGKAGSGSGGASAGAAGTTGSAGAVGTGSCTGTAAFAVGAGNKYAMGAKVVATCNGGTPCTLAKPAGQNGKSYEFSCMDMYNCGTQDPATTNWAQPPWQMTKACE